MSMQRLRSCFLSVLILMMVSAPLTSVADDAATTIKEGAQKVVATVKEGAEKAVETVKEGAEKVADTVKGTAEKVEAKVEAKVEEKAEAKAEEKTEEKAEEAAPKSYFSGKFWALIPPLVAIILALITKEVYSSLFIGVVIGGIFVAEGKFLKVMDVIINDGLIAAVKDTAGVFIFLVLLGVLVALMNRTGAARAFGEWAKKNVKSRTGASFMTFVLGVLIFIDDYFNCLTVGSVMRPVTDSKKISRAKLAYLIDATAAPICMIAPISSWAAAVSEYTKGTGYSGIQLFCRAIPYNFYSLLTIIFVLAITFLKIDFGPMAKHERNAIENDDLFTYGKEVGKDEQVTDKTGSIADLIVPVIILIISCVFAMLYVGGIFESGKSYIDAFADTDATVALPWGGLLALVLILLFYNGRNIFPKNSNRAFMPHVIGNKEAMECIATGFGAMVPAILVLTLATALKNMTGALELKEYIAGIMEHSASSLNAFLPAVIFIVACVLAFATGTSWGTFGILIPIVTAIFSTPTNPLFFIGMSACLAGAVCGDHCSPISDTTIMSSAGARCEHVNHVSTQLPYAIFVAVFSAVAFLAAGFIKNWFVVFPLAVILMLAGLFVMKSLTKSPKEN